MIANKITQAVAAVAPIIGISIGRNDDRLTWRIDFAPDATDEDCMRVLEGARVADIVLSNKEGLNTRI